MSKASGSEAVGGASERTDGQIKPLTLNVIYRYHVPSTQSARDLIIEFRTAVIGKNKYSSGLVATFLSLFGQGVSNNKLLVPWKRQWQRLNSLNQ